MYPRPRDSDKTKITRRPSSGPQRDAMPDRRLAVVRNCTTTNYRKKYCRKCENWGLSGDAGRKSYRMDSRQVCRRCL